MKTPPLYLYRIPTQYYNVFDSANNFVCSLAAGTSFQVSVSSSKRGRGWFGTPVVAAGAHFSQGH